MTSAGDDIDAILAICDSEEQAASSKIEATQQEIDALREQVVGLKRLYRQKEKEKDSVTKDRHRIISRRASLLNSRALVHKLFDELLAMVFQSGAAYFYRRDGEPEWTELSKFLKTIGCVTRHWRRVALRAPSLWCNILHSVHRYFPIKTCVERSGVVPLRVWAGNQGSLVRILSTLALSQTPRTLRELWIRHGSNIPDLADYPSSLERLTITYLNIESCTMFLHLSSDSHPLNHFSSAQQMSIRKTRFLGWNVFKQRNCVATFNVLRSLELLPCSVQDAAIALSLLSAPNLIALLIAVQGGAPPSTDELVLQLAPGAFSSVKQLVLGGRMRPQQMLSVMKHTPGVRLLEVFSTIAPKPDHRGVVNGVINYDDLLHSLHHRGDITLLPQLRKIAFHRCDVTLNGIHELVDSRSSHSPAVEVVAFGKEWKTAIITSLSEQEQLSAKVKVRSWRSPDTNIPAGWVR